MRNQYQLSDQEDPDLLNSLTPGTSPQIAPPVAPPTMSTPAPVATPPPPTAAAPQMAAPAPRPIQLPGMPANIGPSDIEAYLGQQKTALNKYGPEQQMELQKSLNARRDSLGYKATDAGKGFADALMMGVAGAGNPGWQNEFHNQENLQNKEQMDTLRAADESQTKKVESGMTLDQMNPNSPLSKEAQATYGPLFQKLGYPAGKLNGMSKANIDNALQLMTAYGGKEMEAKIKEYDLEVERIRLAGALSHQSAEEKIATEKNKQDALGELAKMPWYSRILHPGVSKALEGSAGISDDASATTPNGEPKVGGNFNGQKIISVKKIK